MPKRYGVDERFKERLSISSSDIKNLLVDLDAAGFKLNCCDFNFPFHTVQVKNIENFSDPELEDLSEVNRIFFTCDGVDCHAQAGFTRQQNGTYGFSSVDKRQKYIAEGLFRDFEKFCAAAPRLSHGFISPSQQGYEKSVSDNQNALIFSEGSSPSDPPVTGAFGLPLHPDENNIVGSSEGQTSTSGPRKWIIGTLIAFVTVVVMAIGLRPAFRQASSSEVSATVATKGLNIEGRARFSFTHSPDADMKKKNDHLVETFDFRNVGRSVARNVRVQCGEPAEGGPHGNLGTIASADQKSIEVWMTTDHADVLHQSDSFCVGTIYMEYDDDSGHRSVSFDRDGNEHDVKKENAN